MEVIVELRGDWTGKDFIELRRLMDADLVMAFIWSRSLMVRSVWYGSKKKSVNKGHKLALAALCCFDITCFATAFLAG